MGNGDSSGWVEAETTTHQDHVIAHVVGATVVGYFIFDETAYLLLDIGFVWNIYLDGEMGLVPHPMMVTGLDIDINAQSELRLDIDDLLRVSSSTELRRMIRTRLASPIQGVRLLEQGNLLRLEFSCDEGGLIVETSVDTREVKIMEFEG